MIRDMVRFFIYGNVIFLSRGLKLLAWAGFLALMALSHSEAVV